MYLDRICVSSTVYSNTTFAKKQFRQFADTLLILEQDAQVRAIKLTDNDKAISYEDFVALTLSTNQSITW